jgi:hypothetical protein
MTQHRAKALLAIGLSCTANVDCWAQTTTDPVQFIIDQGGVGREDSLLVVKFDWNEDSQDDYFIITQSDSELAGNGNVPWTVYLSDGKGNYSIDPSGLLAPSDGLQVARLDEVSGKQAVIALGNRGEETPIYGYYLDGAGRIAKQVLATLRREATGANAAEMRAIADDNEAKIKRFISEPKVLGPEIIPAADRWPAEGPKNQPPPPLQEELGIRYNLVSDPLQAGRDLAYDQATGELLGYVIKGKLVSLREAAEQGLPVKRDIIAERREMEAEARREQGWAKQKKLGLIATAVAVLAAATIAVIRWRRSIAGRETH